MAQQRRKEEYWLRKYGKVLVQPVPRDDKIKRDYRDDHPTPMAPSALPPIKKSRRPQGRMPMFQQTSGMDSFPSKGGRITDRHHRDTGPTGGAAGGAIGRGGSANGVAATPPSGGVLPPIQRSAREHEAEALHEAEARAHERMVAARGGGGGTSGGGGRMAGAWGSSGGTGGSASSGRPDSSQQQPGRGVSPSLGGDDTFGGGVGLEDSRPSQQAQRAGVARDLQAELIVLKAIKARGDVLDRLGVACEKLDSSFGGGSPVVLSQVDPLVRLFYRLIANLRQRTLDAVEAIGAWHRKTHTAAPFVYYGADYLAGIGRDHAFLDSHAFLSSRLASGSAASDPFLLNVTPDGVPIECPTDSDIRRGASRFTPEALRIRFCRKILAMHGSETHRAGPDADPPAGDTPDKPDTGGDTAARGASAGSGNGDGLDNGGAECDDFDEELEAHIESARRAADPLVFLPEIVQYGAARQADDEPDDEMLAAALSARRHLEQSCAAATTAKDEGSAMVAEEEEEEEAEEEEAEEAGASRAHSAAPSAAAHSSVAHSSAAPTVQHSAAALDECDNVLHAEPSAERSAGGDGLESSAGAEEASPRCGSPAAEEPDEPEAPGEAVERCPVPAPPAAEPTLSLLAANEEHDPSSHGDQAADVSGAGGGAPDAPRCVSADGALVEEAMMRSLVMEEHAADMDDGMFLDYAVDAMVASLEPGYVEHIAPGSFTAAGWEIDRALDKIVLGISEEGDIDAVLGSTLDAIGDDDQPTINIYEGGDGGEGGDDGEGADVLLVVHDEVNEEEEGGGDEGLEGEDGADSVADDLPEGHAHADPGYEAEAADALEGHAHADPGYEAHADGGMMDASPAGMAVAAF
ncbi:hypothetical protein FOA52_005185 [Chlamydomonas sp. UWO 241]|nr:hypothetical protein FOA52_005185 [Chlamydomonas sp. UWO 241]